VESGVGFHLASASTETALTLARKLLSKGLAYEKLRSVYYDVTRDKEYGRLLHTDLTKLSLGKTVDMDAYVKDSPHDFTLLKRVSLQDLKLGDALQTPWGNVRPSWFLQMASIAASNLPAVSVVFSGEDKCFPHLDNLRAIWSSGAGLSPAAWMAGGLVQEKREEQTGESACLIRLVEGGAHPLTIRMWLLSTAYRKPLALTKDALSMWEKNRLRFQDATAALGERARGASISGAAREGDLYAAFSAAIEDDLGFYRFWPELFSRHRDLNAAMSGESFPAQDACDGYAQMMTINAVLGVLDQNALPVPESQWPEKAASLVAERERARAVKDYPQADALRQTLLAAGFRLEDAPGGVRLFKTGG